MSPLRKFVPAPLKPLARKVRRGLRGLRPYSLDVLLSPDQLRQELRPMNSSFLIEVGASFSCPVRITNHGSAIWSSTGSRPLNLVFRWLSPRKESLDVPPQLIPLDRPLYPGESVILDAKLLAPEALGHFLVSLQLEQAGSAQEIKPHLIEAQVTGRAAEDIDYHKVYATADLKADYWTVVGPSTKEEFEKLSENKFNDLKKLGLTRDGKVLDIGCGTGQLGVPLENFLSDEGCYYGTDIGEEAVVFCKERFQRPNFQFFRNEMTSVPISGKSFDFVTFYSVFTHTFPDETVLLLAEAKRLLAPRGIIIGDVFTSTMVERCSGNRGAMELNRDHFLRLVALAGLRAELMDAWPWRKYGKREVFRFTHAERPGA